MARDSKRFVVFWSKAAVEAADLALPSLQATLLDNASEIVSRAQWWFLHSLPREAEGSACYVCRGQELLESWEICVQLGRYEAMSDPADAEPAETPVKIARALAVPDNEIFAAFDDLIE